MVSDKEGRDRAYITVEDHGKKPWYNQDQVRRKREEVSTNRTLMMVEASEKDLCERIRDHFNKFDREHVLFQNIYGERFCYTKAYVKPTTGQSVNAYFKPWPTALDMQRAELTPAVTIAHEEAVAYAARLAMENSLKAATMCTYNGHKQCAVEVPWLPADWHNKCTQTVVVDGKGGSLEVVINHRWTPDTNTLFILDAAIIENGVLHTAIEIEKSHANSEQKRIAFKSHGIVSVQIDANELNAICKHRKWEESYGTDVVVKNHPVSKLEPWQCKECDVLERIDIKKRAAMAKLDERKRRKREAYEEEKLTTYKSPVAGKYLKGFLHLYQTKSQRERMSNRLKHLSRTKSQGQQVSTEETFKGEKNDLIIDLRQEWKGAKLYESKYDRCLNTSPPFVEFNVKTDDINFTDKLNGKAVCLKIPKYEDGRFLHDIEECLYQGLDLPQQENS